MANLHTAEIETAPDVGAVWRSDDIASVIRRDTGFAVLFDLPKLLTADAVLIGSTAAKAA